MSLSKLFKTAAKLEKKYLTNKYSQYSDYPELEYSTTNKKDLLRQAISLAEDRGLSTDNFEKLSINELIGIIEAIKLFDS